MTKNIHSSAVIDKSAIIGENVEIGPFVSIGANVTIGDNVKILPNVHIENAIIGDETILYSGCIIGTEPQDLGYKGELTLAVIGKKCQIREYATVNRASGEGNKTIVGDGCLLMTGSHVAHNCIVGNNVILANLATIAGHVTVGDYSFLGGTTVVHQNVRIGEMTIMGGFTGTRQDLPPYAKAEGRPAGIIGINTVGLRRRGLNPQQRTELKRAFTYIWYSDLNTKQALDKIKEEIVGNEYVDNLVNFMESSKRGVTKISGKQDYEED